MAAIDTALRWLVRLSLGGGLVILAYFVFHGLVRGLFRKDDFALFAFFGGAWIVPALALGTWRNVTTGRQSTLFYVSSLISIGLITLLSLSILAMENGFS
jgi:hypothetical protein